MITPIILSGGNGTRLWPMSRTNKPKQFIEFLDNDTMFTKTVKRFTDKTVFNNPIILGNIKHEKLINEEIKTNKLYDSIVMLEPTAKNTAPAICSIIEYLYKNGNKDDIVIFLPSDAYIDDSLKFKEYLIEGEKEAEKGKVVCFGIQPTYPETGYGYIELGKKIKDNTYYVNAFKEKPNLELAKEFLNKGNYLWNGGIFMTKISVMHDLFAKYQKDLLDNIDKTIDNSIEEENKIYLNKTLFDKSEEISIDYAIIEHLNATNLAVVAINLMWSDVGSYKSLYDINNEKTTDRNVIKGKAIMHNSTNCYIKNNKKIICCSDVENLVIIEEDDVILIMNKDKSQNVKKVIEKIKEEDLKDLL